MSNAKDLTDFDMMFANATGKFRLENSLSTNQMQLLKQGAQIGWEMALSRDIDLTARYAEMKQFLEGSGQAGLAGYRLGITDAQNILYEHGIRKLQGPIANKPEGFKE